MSHSTNLQSGLTVIHNGDWSGPIRFTDDPTLGDLFQIILAKLAGDMTAAVEQKELSLAEMIVIEAGHVKGAWVRHEDHQC